jgi:hypothetical protein
MSCPDMHLRRMGIQLASQLPDSLEDALLVLEYAKQVIEHVHGGGDGGGRASNVLTLVPKPPPNVA